MRNISVTHFCRRQTNGIVKDYTIKGWVMDDKRKKWWFGTYNKTVLCKDKE